MFHSSLYPHFYQIFCVYCFYNDTQKFNCHARYHPISNKNTWIVEKSLCSGGPVLPIPLGGNRLYTKYKECINKTSSYALYGTSNCTLVHMSRTNLTVKCIDPVGRSHPYQCTPVSGRWRFHPTNPDFGNYSIFMVYLVLCIICATITLILNCLTVSLIIKSQAMRMGNTVLYATHMVIIDFLIATIVLPLYIALVYGYNQHIFKGAGLSFDTNVEIDKWFARFDLLLLVASFMNLTFLSSDRCMLISKPIWYLNNVSLKKLTPTLAAVWLYALAIFFLYYYVCTKLLFSFMLGYVLPTIVMIASYIMIIYYTKRMELNKDHDQAIIQQRKLERKVTFNLLRLILTFLICWLPYFVVFLRYESYINKTEVEDMSIRAALRWTKLLSYCHCFLDPLLYSFAIPNIRNELKNMWKAKNPKTHTPDFQQRPRIDTHNISLDNDL